MIIRKISKPPQERKGTKQVGGKRRGIKKIQREKFSFGNVSTSHTHAG
jgi:hypothetical protein